MREIAPIATIVGLVAGVIGLVMGGYMSVSVTTLGWLTAAVFIEAILAGAFWYTMANGNDKFSAEELACFSAITMAGGFVLGLLLMGLYIIYPFDNTFAAFMFWPTAGMISLGLFGVALFFVLYAQKSAVIKDYWGVVQGIGMAVVVSVIGTVVSSLCSLITLSNAVMDILGYTLCGAFVVSILASLMPSWISKLRRA